MQKIAYQHFMQDKEQTLSIYPQAKSYKEWLKDSKLVKDQIARLKAAYAASKEVDSDDE